MTDMLIATDWRFFYTVNLSTYFLLYNSSLYVMLKVTPWLYIYRSLKLHRYFGTATYTCLFVCNLIFNIPFVLLYCRMISSLRDTLQRNQSPLNRFDFFHYYIISIVRNTPLILIRSRM